MNLSFESYKMDEMAHSEWEIHKFGGTSLADTNAFVHACELIDKQGSSSKAIVVSAMAGVTNALIRCLETAKNGQDEYLSILKNLHEKHVDAAERLSKANLDFSQDFADLKDILRGIQISRSYSDQSYAIVSGYGEIWSARLMAASFRQRNQQADLLNAREILHVENSEVGPLVQWTKTETLLADWLSQCESDRIVITGFIATDEKHSPTVLGRNGSDYTAAIFGKLLSAGKITIWSDVSGVMSADPRKVPESFVLPRLSYDEAVELAFFGASVLHPSTMAPAIKANIPLIIKNTFSPDDPGTLIGPVGESPELYDHPVKGFSAVNNVALINVEGTGMLGVPGIAQRLFGSLRDVGVSVMMISQGSSEHSICFVVPGKDGEHAKATVGETFSKEIEFNKIQKVDLIYPCSIIAAVGDHMVHQRGIAAKFFSSLSKAQVNVRAIAQGSSERNISVVVDEIDSDRALRASHSGFYLSRRTLSVGLIGPGLIGSTLLDQIEKQQEVLKRDYQVDLKIRGIMNSKKMLLEDNEIRLKNWSSEFDSSEKVASADVAKFTEHISVSHHPHPLVIDCTSNQTIADSYETLLDKRIHIITPNKKANSGELSTYRKLKKLATNNNCHYLYETTVGAGLPIISTLNDLVQTGDQILQIEGVLSGTLSYLFNNYDGHRPFSKIVKEAREKGYTEPDPRDDLSGMDVARKLVILAREAGFKVDISQLEIENLVPEQLQVLSSIEEFMESLHTIDNQIEEKLFKAKANNQVLRYVGFIDKDGNSKVGLRPYSKDHSFAGINGSDNIIAFTTTRYYQQPLVVQGPGAGPEVTAGGVFADILRLTAFLGDNL